MADDEGTQDPPDEERPPKKKRKERVLHTRVPAVLEQELKSLAASLKVPVSNVVRTILEDAVETLDSVGQAAEDEIRGVADKLSRRRGKFRQERTSGKPDEDKSEPSADPPLAGVVGYQPLLLARDERCVLCGETLAAGSQAYLGIRDTPGRRVIVGERCLPFSQTTHNREDPSDDE